MNYINLPEDITYDTISLFNSFSIDDINRIDTNIWINNETNRNGSRSYSLRLGGYISLFNTFGKWDVVNSLRFYGLDYETSYNYNIAVTYKHDRNLSFFIKGTNLFNDALETDYYRINPLSMARTELNNVSVYDRTLWVGWEYQF